MYVCTLGFSLLPIEKNATLGYNGGTIGKRSFVTYEIRYRWINELFISQYSFINLNISHIHKLFRYVNLCIYIYFHGELVRNWCGVWEVDIWKRVHHDKSETYF